MKTQHISEALSNVDDKYIAEAADCRKNRRRKIPAVIAACLVVACLGVGVLNTGILSRKKAMDSRDGDTAVRETVAAAYPADEGVRESGASPNYSSVEKSSDDIQVSGNNGTSYGNSITEIQDDYYYPEDKTEDIGVKIIYTGSMSVETMEFDNVLTDLEQRVADLGGYISDRSVFNTIMGYRRGDFVLRIPAETFEAFSRELRQDLHVTYYTATATDVSLEYTDLESRLTSQRVKLERLQELLSQAKKMEDIITIESSISETQLTIDDLERSLLSMDDRISYSTVNLSLNEVYEYDDTIASPITLGERIGNAFSRGIDAVVSVFQSLLVAIAYGWIWILLAGGIAFGAVRMIRKKRRK